MPRTSKRPAYRVDMTDANRVAVPTLRREHNHARYVITPLGHVYRDDGRLLVPDANLRLKVNGGSQLRSIPKMVFLAFGHPALRARWETPGDPLGLFDPWIEPFGEHDPLTRRRRCTVHDVVLVPHAELIRYGRSGRPPVTRLSILEPPK